MTARKASQPGVRVATGGPGFLQEEALRAQETITAALLLLAAAATAAAQEPAAVVPDGARVRVVTTGRDGAEGVLLRADEHQITLAVPGRDRYSWPTEVTLQVDPTTRVQLHQGQKRHALLGAVIGSAAFGLLGASFTVDPRTCSDPGSSTFCSRGEAVAASALVGAAIGALVGHGVKTERWSAPVRLGRPLRLESAVPQATELPPPPLRR